MVNVDAELAGQLAEPAVVAVPKQPSALPSAKGLEFKLNTGEINGLNGHGSPPFLCRDD